MAYEAIVCKLKNVRPHPTGNSIQLANACGMQVIVGLDNHEDQLGIFFSDDGCLSERMLHENNLYTTKRTKQKDENGSVLVVADPQPLNKDPGKAGYFGKNGRVRAQNFLQERSYGFWTELESVGWTGVDLSTLEDGFTFTALNGEEVCRKYINPATLRHGQKNKKKNDLTTSIRRRFAQLKEHFDTKQLRYEISRIPEGSILYFTEKCHGTSGRTGHVYAEKELGRTKTWWNKYMGWLGKYQPKHEWQIVSGTRRVVMDPDQKVDGGYYSGNTFRLDIHRLFKDLNIPKGMTFYYEICGFTETGTPIMPPQPISKIGDSKMRKLMKKKYGDEMLFSYGCDPDNEPADCRYIVLVYRITVTNEDGRVFELPWPQVKQICDQMYLDYVPDLDNPYFFYDQSECGRESLTKYLEAFLDQDSQLDSRHLCEGICVRVEAPNGDIYILKDKGYYFKVLEGIVKNDETVVDTEEAEDLAADGE